MRDQREVTLEKLLQPAVASAKQRERLGEHGGDLVLRDGEDARHQQAGAGADAGGDLLSRQIRFGDDAARITLESMGGAPDSDHESVAALSLSAYSSPSPASSSIAMSDIRKQIGALRALIQVGRGDAETVPASGRRRIIDVDAQAVASEEPGEGLTHPAQVAMIVGGQVGAAEREHERRCVDRLLVRVGLHAIPGVPAGVADQHQTIVLKTGPFQERQRLARDLEARPVARDCEAAEQRQRQQRVVVGQGRLEPGPIGAGLGAVAGDEALGQRAQQGGGGRHLWMSGQEGCQTEHRLRAATRAELLGEREAAFEHLAGEHPLPVVPGQADGLAQRPQRPPRAILRRPSPPRTVGCNSSGSGTCRRRSVPRA